MGEEHARVAPALGAFAVGALDPEEAAAVRAHLVTCAACRVEAERLGRAAAWLGGGHELPPPERLRDAVLAAVREQPAVPGPADEALAAARADLDQLVGGLTGEQWRLPVVHGWDVGGLLRHLEAPAGPGPEATLRKAFETWIHADDVRVALGRPPSPPAPAHLHAVVALGVRLLPPACCGPRPPSAATEPMPALRRTRCRDISRCKGSRLGGGPAAAVRRLGTGAARPPGAGDELALAEAYDQFSPMVHGLAPPPLRWPPRRVVS